MTSNPKRLRQASWRLAAVLLICSTAFLGACGKEAVSETAATKPAKPAPTGGIGGTGFADNGVGGTGMSNEGPGGIGGTGLADKRAGGIGGTGLTDRSSGIGGTGLADRSGGVGGTGLADRSGGIGGTGLKDWGTIGANGIGGTGIVGIVTGFGSIWVNGAEVQIASTTTVQVNGASVPASRLSVGDLVAVHVDGAANLPTARSVASVTALEGPVQASDPETGILKVLGQRVHVAAGTIVPGGRFPTVGDTVQVDGLMHVNGMLEAASIEPGGNIARRSGTLQAKDGGWTVDNVPVQPSALANAQALIGKPVIVSGTWNATTLEGATLAADPVVALIDRVTQVSLQGYLTSLGNETVIMVGGTRLQVKAVPNVVRSVASSSEPLVVVTGTISADRTVTATGIRVVPLTGAAGVGGASGKSPSGSDANASSTGTAAGPERPGKATATGNPWGGPPASPPKGPPDKSHGKGGCGTPPCGKGKGKGGS